MPRLLRDVVGELLLGSTDAQAAELLGSAQGQMALRAGIADAFAELTVAAGTRKITRKTLCFSCCTHTYIYIYAWYRLFVHMDMYYIYYTHLICTHRSKHVKKS